MTSSELPGFYRLSVDERRRLLAERTRLSTEALAALAGRPALGVERANCMIENAIGVFELPFGVCANMRVDGRDRLIPMAVEEPSVVAAASHGAKLLRAGGGVSTRVTAPIMIGQLQVLDVPAPDEAEAALLAARDDLIELANTCAPTLAALGGARDLEVRHLPPAGDDDPLGPMLVVHLLVDVKDAMGANAVNRMCEALAPEVETLTEGRVRLRILSNLADRRVVTAVGRVPIARLPAVEGTSSREVAEGIVEASVFAERDPYRAATHNKGIMNGVDAVLLATGQDWRAVEAGAHAYAARSGRYGPLATWRIEGDHLVGRLEIPMAVGTVGGIVRSHPTVAAALELAEVEGAGDLASLVAAVGLAQNLCALRALADEGINHGHLRLHARNVAAAAGASVAEIDAVARRIADAGKVAVTAARSALEEMRSR